MKLSFLFLLPVFLFITSCDKYNQRTEAAIMVSEWVGKQIQFPEEFTCNFLGRDTLSSLCSDFFNKEYKILLYVDSTGCTSCKLKLFVWKQFIQESDSLLKDQVGFLFYFHPRDRKELNFLLKKNQLNYPVFIDPENKIGQLNNFPAQPLFQCFLLNKDNEVLMIGNPVYNPRIWELYKERISGIKDKKLSSLTSVKIENNHHDYGNILMNEEKEMVFRIKNTGKTSLIINHVNTSCGCTSVDWDKRPIDSGEITEIKIIMKPDETGYFNKAVEIYGNMENSPLKLTVSGNAIRDN